ncbi:zinc-binding dehydrogenase [Streptomyces sp. NPDC004166]|uniref:zinc-binding dehydrogenase n=1 Tax=Streptomyces sp. NPDC093269 TaxID=3366038 RepID=UPI00382B405B
MNTMRTVRAHRREDPGESAFETAPRHVPGFRDDAARAVRLVVEPDRDELGAISESMASGQLSRPIERVVPLGRTPAAYEALNDEHQRGEVVVHVAGG